MPRELEAERVVMLSVAIVSALENHDYDDAFALLDVRGREIDRLQAERVRLGDETRERLAEINARIHTHLQYGKEQIARQQRALGQSRRLIGKYREPTQSQFDAAR